MNQNSSVRKLARCAVVAAIYVVLCMALQPFSYGAVQVRVAEALCLLPAMALGLFLGIRSVQFLPERVVKRVIIVLLILSGLSLIVGQL